MDVLKTSQTLSDHRTIFPDDFIRSCWLCRLRRQMEGSRWT